MPNDTQVQARIAALEMYINGRSLGALSAATRELILRNDEGTPVRLTVGKDSDGNPALVIKEVGQ